MLEFDAQVGAEDTVLVERVQKGVSGAAGANSLEHGRLMGDSEHLIANFQSIAARRAGLTTAERSMVNIW